MPQLFSKTAALSAALVLILSVVLLPFEQGIAQEVIAKTPVLPTAWASPSSSATTSGTIGDNIAYTVDWSATSATLRISNVAEPGTLWFWVGLYDRQRRLFSVRRTPVAVRDGSGVGIVLGESYAIPYYYRLVYFGKVQPPEPPRPSFAFRMTEPDRPEMLYQTPDLMLALVVSQRQVGFILRNTSPAPIRVIWDESAYVDQGGQTHRIIHQGIRYNERDRSMPPSLVPPGADLRDLVYPASYVSWSSSRWVERPLYMPWEATPFTLGVFLTLEVRGQKAGLSFRFTATGSAWPQEFLDMFAE